MTTEKGTNRRQLFDFDITGLKIKSGSRAAIEIKNLGKIGNLFKIGGVKNTGNVFKAGAAVGLFSFKNGKKVKGALGIGGHQVTAGIFLIGKGGGPLVLKLIERAGLENKLIRIRFNFCLKIGLIYLIWRQD